jgi:hypothetical protein
VLADHHPTDDELAEVGIHRPRAPSSSSGRTSTTEHSVDIFTAGGQDFCGRARGTEGFATAAILAILAPYLPVFATPSSRAPGRPPVERSSKV